MESTGTKRSSAKSVVMLYSMSFISSQGRYLRAYNEAKSLVDAGNNVTIIAWDRDCREPRQEIVGGIKVERIRSRAGFQRGPLNLKSFLVFYARLLPKLFRKKADVIHCFNVDMILPGLLVAKLKGKKAVLDLCEPSYYTNWPKKYSVFVSGVQLFERFFSKRFDYVLVHGLFQMRKFRGYGVQTLEQIGSYPNRGLIVNKISKRNDPEGSVVVGRIGSIYKNNGIEEMIEGFRRLVVTIPRAKLLLAGKVFDEFKEEFDRLITPLGDLVEATGEFSPEDLPALYERIDVSLQLSRRTDWFKNITPTKLFESLANGVPVVGSDTGDVKEILEEFDCGLIVDETDPESICLGLRKLVEDPAMRFRMAENGLRAVREKYSWELMGQKLLEIYTALDTGRTDKTKDSGDPEVGRCVS